MDRIRQLLIALVVMNSMLLTIFGCNRHSPPELPPIDYYLVITDSIGIESGDSNYVFVWPVDAVYTPDGDIAVLDMMKNAVLFYTPEGEFIRSVGEKGEGPGRFMTPYGMCFYSDGSFLVECGNGISRFNSNGEFVHRMVWPRYDPHLIAALDDSSFIGRGTIMESNAQGLTCTSTIGRWEEAGNPATKYFTFEFEYPLPDENGVMDLSRHRDKHIISCASHDGRVFYTVVSVDSFEITGFEQDGTRFFHVVDEDYRRTPKTEEEMQIEIQSREKDYNRLGTGASGLTIRPDPYKPSIIGLHIDGYNRLWIRLGYCPGIVYRVYDMNGEILFHATTDFPFDIQDYLDWAISINDNGFLAFPSNPDDYPRIYMLSLVELEHH